jgi:integrase
MRLYQRTPGGSYWFAFHHRGKPYRRSTGTTDRQAAQEYADQFRASLWRADKLGERPAVAWDAAVLDWLEHNQSLRGLPDRKDHLRWATKHLSGKPLAQIDRAELERLARLKAADGVKESTVNRYLASISAILGYAVERKWLGSRPRVPKLPEAGKRIRWATPKQAAKLVEALPDHLGPMAAFALATGLRRANVMRLEWDAVDLQRRIAWVHADEAKGRRTIPVPLNDAALAILRGQRGKHRRVVFPYRGRAMAHQGAPAWRAACKVAGLKDFRWHDLRHTWASWHVQNGTPLAVLQELGGWRSLAMVMRYAHLAPSHLAAYAGNSGIPVQNRYKGDSGSRQEKAA